MFSASVQQADRWSSISKGVEAVDFKCGQHLHSSNITWSTAMYRVNWLFYYLIDLNWGWEEIRRRIYQVLHHQIWVWILSMSIVGGSKCQFQGFCVGVSSCVCLLSLQLRRTRTKRMISVPPSTRLWRSEGSRSGWSGVQPAASTGRHGARTAPSVTTVSRCVDTHNSD